MKKEKDKNVVVMLRVSNSTLERVKAVTGIQRNATAVSAFVNLKLQKMEGGAK